ncbi:hypothetical protein [Nitrosopumilus sp.]|nr:hypothetical protein [Nitrosopumilus sp.]
MEYEIVKNPMELIQFTMNKGEKITAEAAAMVFIRETLKHKLKCERMIF